MIKEVICRMRPNNIVAVIHIGSTKVCCCIANTFGDGQFKIIGIGYCICLGVKSGVIVDIRSVEKSIAKAVENAEKMANLRIKSVYINISGKNIESKVINVSLDIGGRIIRDEDMFKLFNHCHDENDEKVAIHSIPMILN